MPGIARRPLTLIALTLLLAGCGSHAASPPATAPLRPQLPAPTGPDTAVSIGRGPRFQRPAAPLDGTPRGRLVCLPAPATARAHLELFAAHRVVIIAPGIGAGPGCSYPARTHDRSGVVEVRGHVTIGDLFTLWGAPLGSTDLAGFPGQVRVYVAGRRIRRDPRAVVLTPDAQIVLAVGPRVPVHRAFRFPG